MKKFNLRKSFKQFKKSKLFLIALLALIGGVVWLSVSLLGSATQVNSEAKGKCGGKSGGNFCSPTLSVAKCKGGKVGATYGKGLTAYKCERGEAKKNKPGVDNCGRVRCVAKKIARNQICATNSDKKCVNVIIGTSPGGGAGRVCVSTGEYKGNRPVCRLTGGEGSEGPSIPGTFEGPLE